MLQSVNKNLRIAILGASSQVGSSIAFYLKYFTQHEPICFIRSKYSSVFFDMANIKTIGVDIKDTQLLKKELKDVDVVLDFSLPSAEGFEMLRIIKQNIDKIISATPPHAVFIYMSSIMAYGMPSRNKQLRSYLFPRALYGFIKRKAEKNVRSSGAKYKVPVYNFRLGQVHGFMQSVSESFIDKLSSVKVAYLDGKETDLTNTIFISSLSEAIIACGLKQIKASTYTLISYPQWTLYELYNYYFTRFSLYTDIIYQPKLVDKRSLFGKLFFKKIKQYRAFIETYILTKLSSASIYLKGKYRVVEINAEINEDKISYIDQNVIGTPTLPIIKNLDCSISSILEKEKAMESVYITLLNKHTTAKKYITPSFNKILHPAAENTYSIPQLSVVIPTYNRTDSLERILDFLKVQENIILEIIVVDQNKPGYFNETLNAKLDGVTRIIQHIPNVSMARNNGFKRSTAPYILFLDDDLIPEPNFCKKGLDIFNQYPLVKSFVPLVYSSEGKEFAFSDAWKKLIKFYQQDTSVFSITDSISAAVFFERSYFQSSGGFDIYLFDFAKAAEDMELFLRMIQRNMTLWFVPFVEIFHDEKVPGGCEFRTADYWISRRKNVRAMAYRLRSQNKTAGNFSFKNLIQISRSFVINKQVLKSGIKNIFKEFIVLINSIKESQKFYVKHKHVYSNSPITFIED